MAFLPALLSLSAALCMANVFLFPQILPGKPITELFILITGINFSLFATYKVLIYPYWFSPFRYYTRPKGAKGPLLGHGDILWEKPAGDRMRRFINEVPNNGIIRFPGFLNRDWCIVTDPTALADMLVHKNYDFEKPGPLRKFLSIILGDGLIVVEGDEHKFQRKHLMPAFSFRHIKNLYPIFWAKSVEMAHGMISEINEKQDPYPEEKKSANPEAVVEINHWANKTTLDIIGVAGLGRDFNAIKNPDDELVKAYEEILEPTTEKAVFFALNTIFPRWIIAALPWGLNDRLKKTTDALKDFCQQVITEKKETIKLQGNESVDILSILMKSNDFADENLVDQLLTFLAAGHETTSSAFTWTTYLLAKHPEFQTRLRAEIRAAVPSPSNSLDASVDLGAILESLSLLNGLTNEVLRLYPTVPVTLRVAVRDTSISNQPVPSGTRLYLAPWAINRSTKIWGPHAEEFHPERWIHAETGKPNNTGGVSSNYYNMTFLHGPRSCIGERFAKSELKVLIAVFCGRFEVEMADPNEVPVSAGAITTKPKNGMSLRTKVLDGW